jgi:hypothetical protein
MTTATQEKLHAQHRKWQDDHSMWRADMDEWRKQLRTAIDAISEVEGMLRDSLEALEIHADAVWESGHRVHAHELALCQESIAGERRKTDKQWAAIHHRQSAQHERVADAHERIKRHHHRLIATVMRLLEQARKAV